MRSILVDARPGLAGTVRVETGLALARHFGGHVRLLVDTPVDRYVAADGMGGSMVCAEGLRVAMAADDAFAARIAERLSHEDVCCDVVRTEAEPVEGLASAALLADVVVVSRADPLAGDLPLAIGCPVFAVNRDRVPTFPLGRVAIAWDGEAPAANALRASLPLLATAGAVTVFMVEADAAAFPATDVAAYLSRHGIGVELRVLPRQGSVEETLAAAVASDGSDLLVMGAYGHSRLREFLFGGVTRHFLESASAPDLLLAH